MSIEEQFERSMRRGNDLAWSGTNPLAGLPDFQKALDLMPDSAMAHWCIGSVFSALQPPRWREAQHSFEQAARLAPEWGEPHVGLGSVLYGQDRYEEAIAEYEIARRLEPGDSRPAAWIGECLYRLGRYDETIRAFQESLALKPPYGEMDLRMMLADAYLAAGQIEPACDEWRQVGQMEAVWSYEKGVPQRARDLLQRRGVPPWHFPVRSAEVSDNSWQDYWLHWPDEEEGERSADPALLPAEALAGTVWFDDDFEGKPLQILAYGSFINYPRVVIAKVGELAVKLENDYDVEDDTYADHYRAYVLEGVSVEAVSTGTTYYHDYTYLPIGTIPLEELDFDPTRTRSLRSVTLEAMVQNFLTYR